MQVTITLDCPSTEVQRLLALLLPSEPPKAEPPKAEPEPPKAEPEPPKAEPEPPKAARRGRPRKEPVAEAALIEESPAPPAPITDADLSKACNGAMQRFKAANVADGVVKIRALIAQFAGNDVRVAAIPAEMRADFVSALGKLI